jgi:glycosyltransferase involved in cell wall biosynthesis
VIDWIHAVDPAWDFVSATAPVAQHIDLRTAISQTAADCLRLAGVPENHIRVIRNGIDLDRFLPAPPAAGNTILYAGRLDSVKRPLLLVEIAAELAKLRDDFQFLVAGVGPEAAALHERLGRSGLGSRFRLLGHADDMPAVLAQASVVLIPSAAEGIPLVALEAFATERPVVCANVGAVSEAVTPDCGVLIEPGPGEPARFARALHELLSDPERRTALGRAGRRKVESDYSRAAAQLAYRNLFAEVAAAV